MKKRIMLIFLLSTVYLCALKASQSHSDLGSDEAIYRALVERWSKLVNSQAPSAPLTNLFDRKFQELCRQEENLRKNLELCQELEYLRYEENYFRKLIIWSWNRQPYVIGKVLDGVANCSGHCRNKIRPEELVITDCCRSSFNGPCLLYCLQQQQQNFNFKSFRCPICGKKTDVFPELQKRFENSRQCPAWLIPCDKTFWPPPIQPSKKN
ncbi:hypothetical protein A3J41_00290 [candidate division TM6 bacterium RIFCSPHIGHO2_12_FULL_38_8]|nr:MAG: hypothetical protein A3J41_00290 [candidate division TM6 bacterium RIFCSPHIGHO2_12_FULL_38_8]